MTRQHGALYRRVQNAGKALGVSDSPWCQCERKPTVSVVWREDEPEPDPEPTICPKCGKPIEPLIIHLTWGDEGGERWDG